jgi:predicted aldo/keto reductase-like oxidoreductase
MSSLGRLDFSVSRIALGLRHLSPHLKDLIRHAIELGVKYVDLGYPYDAHLHEAKMKMVREALDGADGEGVRIALTLPTYEICRGASATPWVEGATEILGRQVDLCLFGFLREESWSRLKAQGAIEWMEKMRETGNVKVFGFSMHDDVQVLRRILADYEGWEICQFQYSFLDVDHHPGIGGLQVASEQRKGVIVSEPLKGGRILKGIPDEVADVWSRAGRREVAELALRWVLGHKEVSTVIVGTMDAPRLERDLEIAQAEGCELTVEELTLLNTVRERYRKLRPIPCLSCYLCMPCPVGIDAPRVMELFNDASVYGDLQIPKTFYSEEGHRPQTCTECGLCEKRCPRKIPISHWLKEAMGLFEN